MILQIIKEISAWPNVTIGPYRFGGIEFRLGKKELGHLHADKLADLPFPMDIRNYLIEAGRVSPHHFLPKSGWVSKSIKGEEDVPEILELFRMHYVRMSAAERKYNVEIKRKD